MQLSLKKSCSLVTLPFWFRAWGLPCDLGQLPKPQTLLSYLGNAPWDLMVQTYKGSVGTHKGRSGHMQKLWLTPGWKDAEALGHRASSCRGPGIPSLPSLKQHELEFPDNSH